MFKFGDKVTYQGSKYEFVSYAPVRGDGIIKLLGSDIKLTVDLRDLTPGWPGEASEKVLMRALEQCAHCLWMMHPVTPHGPQTAEEWKAKFIAQAQKEVDGE